MAISDLDSLKNILIVILIFIVLHTLRGLYVWYGKNEKKLRLEVERIEQEATNRRMIEQVFRSSVQSLLEEQARLLQKQNQSYYHEYTTTQQQQQQQQLPYSPLTTPAPPFSLASPAAGIPMAFSTHPSPSVSFVPESDAVAAAVVVVEVDEPTTSR